MLQKLKDFWQNPYAAPLTEPLRGIGKTVAGFVEPYTEAFDKAKNPRFSYERDKTPIGRFLSCLMDVHNSFFTVATNFVAFAAGIVAGGGTAAVAGYSGLAGAGAAAQWGGTVLAGIAGGTAGFVAAPVVMVAVTAFVGVVAGAVVGGVPGVIKGTQIALKHHHDLKNPPPAVAVVAPAASPVSTIKDRIATIQKEFKQLPKSEQNLVLGLLEDAADPAASLQTRVLRNVDKMNDTQRTALAEVLEEKLAGAFDAVASKKAAEAGVLDEDVTVKPIATKLRRRGASPANTAGAA